MKTIKKILALAVTISIICSFAGCKKDDDKDSVSKPEISDEVKNSSDADSSAQSSLNEEAKSDSALLEEVTESLYGTWVVEKTVAYDGPLKDMAKQLYDIYYYVGAEYTFTKEGICQGPEDGVTSTFEVISDTKITGVSITDGQEYVHDYELNGDELVLYGTYTGAYANFGRCGAIHFVRK